jgi:serine/threonine-protein kinase
MKHALAVSALALAVLSPARAHAQASGDEGRAEALFNAAKQLRDSGQVADACPMFAESKRLSPGVGVTLYLADCYERTGRTASAWQQFREAEKLSREHGDEKRAEVARARAHALEPKLGELTVAAGAASHEGWEVLVDGTRLPPQQWNVALAMDPGDHVVTIKAPEQAPRTVKAHVDGGSQASVPIDESGISGLVPIAPVSTEPASGASGAPAGGGSARLGAGLALVGVGVLGLSLGTFFLVKRNQSMSNGNLCDPASEDKTATTASTVAFTAGGVALASALVLYLTTPKPKVETAWVVAPALLPGGGGGALVHTTF